MSDVTVAREPEHKHSIWGIVSFIISLLVGSSVFCACAGSSALQSGTRGGSGETSVGDAVLGWIIIGAIFVNLIGLAFGIVGLTGRNRKKVFPILGTIFNLLVLVLTLALIGLGLYIISVGR